MKKTTKTILSLLLAACILLGFQPVQAESKKLKVVTTNFPAFDFVRQIAGDKVDLSLLIKAGSDSHAYELSPQDVKDIGSADLFVYAGGDNDKKFEDVIAGLGDKKPQTFRFIDQVKVLEEEIVDGMQHDEHDHEHGEGDDHHHPEFTKEDVEERALAEFAGEYRNLSGFVLDGDFDAVAEVRKEEGETAQEYKDSLVKNFGTALEYINVTADGLALVKDGKVVEEAAYTAEGIFFDESEEGHLHAMYKYRKTAEGGELPTYILLSDHEIKANQERGDNPHIHMAYSNVSYEDANAQEVVPFYIFANKTKADIEAWLIGDDEEAGHGDHAGHQHDHAVDEHVWTSPDNAKAIVEALAKTLSKLDEANADTYRTNYKAYNLKLDELEKKLEEVVKSAKNKLLIFGDRFPFRYLVEDLDLDYYAAFPGCSSEVEASAQTVAFLIDKVKENNLPIILKIELTSDRIAQTIAEATGAKILVMNSGHNLSAEEFAAGTTFLDLMMRNVDVLREALQ